MLPPLTVLRIFCATIAATCLTIAAVNFLRLTVAGSRAEPVEFLWSIIPGAVGIAAASALASSVATEWGLRHLVQSVAPAPSTVSIPKPQVPAVREMPIPAPAPLPPDSISPETVIQLAIRAKLFDVATAAIAELAKKDSLPDGPVTLSSSEGGGQ